ncbi:MAG: hypothetical protein IKJ16_05610 [Agathobacter sp.]|nr:hypothetical protein [Agathobacter sp.]
MNISFLKEKGNKYVVFVLIGLLILVLCIPTGTKEEASYEKEESTTSLQNQLEQVLSSMEGVGKVKVMITTQEDTNSSFGIEDSTGEVSGVLVVAEGAGSPSVKERIKEAIKALFSIDVHKISIVKMRPQEE